MERITYVGPGVCTALQLRLVVDSVLNEGAIREACDATDATQGPEAEITDITGSVYNSEEVEFHPNVVDCGLCGGEASLHRDGSVTADDCRISGSCELSWAQMHGSDYLKDDGELDTELLPCGGFECRAIVNLSLNGDGIAADLARGRCAVDVKGEQWRTVGREALNGMKPDYDNTAEMEPFDGERL